MSDLLWDDIVRVSQCVVTLDGEDGVVIVFVCFLLFFYFLSKTPASSNSLIY